MKVRHVLMFSLAFFVSDAAMAATQIDNSAGKQKIGVVSAGGASDLDDLTAKLNKKAEEDGASSFKIIAAGGKNEMYGDAEIYK